MVLCPLEAVAYAILDITHKSIKLLSIEKNEKFKKTRGLKWTKKNTRQDQQKTLLQSYTEYKPISKWKEDQVSAKKSIDFSFFVQLL